MVALSDFSAKQTSPIVFDNKAVGVLGSIGNPKKVRKTAGKAPAVLY
jgi:hypothetical protein